MVTEEEFKIFCKDFVEKYEGSLDLNSLKTLPENFNVTVGGNLVSW